MAGLRNYPKIGRTTNYIDPTTKKPRPGRITAVAGQTISIKGRAGEALTGMNSGAANTKGTYAR